VRQHQIELSMMGVAALAIRLEIFNIFSPDFAVMSFAVSISLAERSDPTTVPTNPGREAIARHTGPVPQPSSRIRPVRGSPILSK
jgi:hypothetical protein